MKIIIFCLPGLGDALLFTPSLHLLRKHYPRAEIVGLTMFPFVRDVLETNPDLTSVHYFPFTKGSTRPGLEEALRLRRRHFDVSITGYPAYRREYHLASFVIGAKTRVAHRFHRGFFSELTFLNTDTVPVDERLHNAENNANLLRPFDLTVDWVAFDRTPLTLRLTSEDESAAAAFLASEGLTNGRLVGIHPGTINYRNAERRRWPPGRFAEFADRLAKRFGTHTLIFEGPSEAGVGEDIRRRMSAPATVVREERVRVVAALVRACRLFASNDSGLMHVAAAMRRPVVAIFGQTDPRWVYPWQTPHTIVRADPAIVPSYHYTLRSFPPCPALETLDADTVIERARATIDPALANRPERRDEPSPTELPSHDQQSWRRFKDGLRILVLNWRDWTHPKAGGAEWVTRRLAQDWQRRGASVTLFTARYPDAADEDRIDGVPIVRRGHQWSVHLAAWRWLKRHRGFDVIVDEINTIPFLAPAYARAPVVAYVNQLAREAWFAEAPWPLSWIGHSLEPFLLRMYRDRPTLTLSASTERDLRRLGFARLTVFPVAPTVTPPESPPPKEPTPTFVTLGRVTPSKRVAHALRALATVRKRFPNARLWVVGRENLAYLRSLLKLRTTLGLDGAVDFLGYLDEGEKVDRLARAWALLATSFREGWGLMVTDAAACGTPSLGYDVPGLRDSIADGRTGLLCPGGDPDALARNAIRLIDKPRLRAALGSQARTDALGRTWDAAAAETWNVLLKAAASPATAA